VARLEAVVGKLDGPSQESFPAVTAFDERFNPKIEGFLSAAKAIDSEVVEMSQFIVDSFREVRRIIVCACKFNKPDDVGVVLKPLVEVKNAGIKWCDIHYRTKWVNQEKAVHEALSIFDWVAYGPNAGSFVNDMIGAVECYTNKVAMEFRGKDENQVSWVQNLLGALRGFPEYINDYHKNGLSWNLRAPKAKGPVDLGKESSEGASVQAPAPAPAPALAPSPVRATTAAQAPERTQTRPKVNISGLAQAYNPEEGQMPARSQSQPPAPVKKEPILKEGRPGLWNVEFFDGKNPELPEDVNIGTIVSYFQCKNCVLDVPKKVKGLSFLSCERVTLTLSDVIGPVSITRCKRVVIYVKGKIPSFSIDNCDSVQVNLNEQSIDCQCTCAQSQGINVVIPDLAEEGNTLEFPVPEQILVYVKDRKLVHEVYVHD
jgi:adenylyl cyclase-associated protein